MIDILRHICDMYFSTTIIDDLIEYAHIKNADIKELESELPALKKQKYIDYTNMVKSTEM